MLQLLLFILCYFGGFISSFLYHRGYAFATYQLVYFFYPHGPSRWYSASLPMIPYSFTTVALMMSVYLLNFKECNKNRLMAAPQLVCAYIFGAYFYLLGFFGAAVNPERHNEFSILFIKTLIIMSIAYKLINTEKILNVIIFAYIGGATYMGLLVNQVGRNSRDRVAGVGTVDGPDTNDMAASIVPASVLALYWFWMHSTLKIRIPMVISGALVVNALVLINSRGAFLGVIGCCGYFMLHLWFSKFRRKGQRLGVVVLTLLGISSLFIVLDESAIERFYSISDDAEASEEDSESGGTRMFFWAAAYEMSKDYPLGMGFKGFNKFSDEYLPPDLDTGGSRSRTVHSTWFQTLNETGYPGLIIYLLMWLYCFRTLRQCRKVAIKQNNFELYYKFIALEAALIGYMLPQTFLNRMTAEVPYWIILFSACAYNIYVLKEKQVTSSNPKI